MNEPIDTDKLFADIKKAYSIITVLKEVLIYQQKGWLNVSVKDNDADVHKDTATNRVRVFNLFCKFGEFSTESPRQTRPASKIVLGRPTIRIIDSLRNESYKLKTTVNNFATVVEKDTHLSDLGYTDRVKELLEIGLLERVSVSRAVVKIDTLNNLSNLLNKYDIKIWDQLPKKETKKEKRKK